jgi:phosphate butyryltransferase
MSFGKGAQMQTEMIENRTFDEIRLGDTATLVRAVRKDDIDLFAVVSGDINPASLDPAYAATDMYHRVVAHGMFGASIISAALGTKLPGPGTIYVGQDLRFLKPVGIGDTLTVTLTVVEKQADKNRVKLECAVANQHGELVISGTADVIAPSEKIRQKKFELPDVRFSRHERFNTLMEAVAQDKPPLTAIVHPCSAAAIGAAVEAAEAKLIVPILVGPRAKILKAADDAGVDLDHFRIIDTPYSDAAAREAVALVGRGEAELIMKGSLHTDELLHAVLAKDSNLRTERRLSHVYLMDVPSYPRPLLVTDAAINIAPDLAAKRDIIQNAIDLAHVMGIELPRVAILSAVETINGKLQSTLDAAALCKMADRGQITGGLLDGPLAFDNAVSLEAAAEKDIVSPVAGQADILVVPDLEAGNILAKQLTFLAGADAAGIVLGARVPIILTSRADAERTRMASCAVGVLLARRKAQAIKV